jgi:hypothetical protein
MTELCLYLALVVALGGLVTDTLMPARPGENDDESDPPRSYY